MSGAGVSDAQPLQTPSASEPEWMSLVRHPRFREAVERNAALIVAGKDRMSPALKWLTNDLGRASTLNRLHILNAFQSEITVGDLLARVRIRHTASDGRVIQILRRAEAAGLIDVEDRAGPWSRRRVMLRTPIFDIFRDRARSEIESASLVIPEIRPALDALADGEFLVEFMAGFDRFDGVAPADRGPPNPGIRHFLMHDAGLVMLYDLILHQSPTRARLLEGAPFSRTRLASRFAVSRTHVRRVFEESAEAGLVSFPDRDRIAFSPRISEEAERHFALTFQVVATNALAALRSSRVS